MMERRFTLSRKDRFSLGLTLVFKLFSQMEKVQTEAKDNDSEKGIPDKVGHLILHSSMQHPAVKNMKPSSESPIVASSKTLAMIPPTPTKCIASAVRLNNMVFV